MELSIVFGLSKLQNLLVCTRLLVSELVARECQNFEATILEFLMDLNQLCVVLMSQPSLGGDIYNHIQLLTLNKALDLLNLLTRDKRHRNFIHRLILLDRDIVRSILKNDFSDGSSHI